MEKASFHILRVGMAITFLWIGILIFQNPESWGGYILLLFQNLLFFTLKTTMLIVAFIDIVIGFLLLIDYLTFWASFLGALYFYCFSCFWH